MGFGAILAALLSSCGDSDLEVLEQHPLANPRVTVVEPAHQAATSGDISTGVMNGSSIRSKVFTIYEHDDTPEQRDQIVAEITAHAEEIGCEVTRVARDAGKEPYVTYAIGCPDLEDVITRISVSRRRVTVVLESFS